jgi:hypothetical protein
MRGSPATTLPDGQGQRQTQPRSGSTPEAFAVAAEQGVGMHRRRERAAAADEIDIFQRAGGSGLCDASDGVFCPSTFSSVGIKSASSGRSDSETVVFCVMLVYLSVSVVMGVITLSVHLQNKPVIYISGWIILK